jgi:hypothetical protein
MATEQAEFAEQLREERAASESVPHPQDLVNEWLIQHLDIKRQTFEEGIRPLQKKEKESFNSWLDLLQETDKSLAKRSRSSRSRRLIARGLLKDIFLELGPDVFLLCTLAIGYTRLVELKSKLGGEDLISFVRSWWSTVLYPEGLTETASELCKAKSVGALIVQYSNIPDSGGKQKRSHVQDWTTDQRQNKDHRPQMAFLHRTMSYRILLSIMMKCKMLGIQQLPKLRNLRKPRPQMKFWVLMDQ